MGKLSFQNFFQLKEMAAFGMGGKWGNPGEDHTRLPDNQLLWTLQKAKDGNPFYFKKPNGQRYSNQEIINIISQELENRGIDPNQSPSKSRKSQQSSSPQPKSLSTPQPQTSLAPQSDWIYAKALVDHDHGIISAGEDLAVQQQPDKNWRYVTLDGKGSGYFTPQEISNVIQSVKVDNKPLKAPTIKALKDLIAQKFPKEGFGPNEYQQKILDEFQNTDKNIFIEALAGSGKTTTLKMLAKLKKSDEKWLYLVFNKKNQLEAQPQFPGVDVRTSHAFAGEVLKLNSDSGRISKTDLPPPKGPDKISKVIQSDWFAQSAEYDHEIPKHLLWPFKSSVKRLVGLAKNNALHPDEDIDNTLKAIIKDQDIDTTLVDPDKPSYGQPKDYTDDIIAMTKYLMQETMPGKGSEEFVNFRDHDDSLWWVAIHSEELGWPRYDVVLVDESQDFNKARQKIVQKLMENGSRIVAVGDENQSIYGFTGADSNAFKNVESLLGTGSRGISKFTLPENYRSGTSIIDSSNRDTKVKGLIAARKHKGKIENSLKYAEVMEQVKNEWQKYGHLLQETAFLCRTNAPLFLVALQLLKENIPFVIVGKDFSSEITQFIKKIAGKLIAGPKDLDLDSFDRMLNSNLSEKSNKWAGNIAKQEELKEVKELTEAVLGVMNFVPSHKNTVKGLLSYISDIFKGIEPTKEAEDAKKLEDDPLKHVVLSSAHKAKGLEFRRVVLIRSDLFPHPKSKTPSQQEQERNLYYVARTRPTHSLYITNDDQPGGRPEKEESIVYSSTPSLNESHIWRQFCNDIL